MNIIIPDYYKGAFDKWLDMISMEFELDEIKWSVSARVGSDKFYLTALTDSYKEIGTIILSKEFITDKGDWHSPNSLDKAL